MQKTMEVRVVGLAYNSVNLNMRKTIQQGAALSLRRQPTNPHDENAIQVLLQNYPIGHLSRRDAAILGPSMDSGVQIKSVRCANSVRVRENTKSFKAYVTVELPAASPKPLQGISKHSGIYKIESKLDNKSYIGQAQDISKRIQQHRNDLILGIHANRELQRLWNKRQPSDFSFSIAEKAPDELGAFGLQNWLARREQHWIASERKNGRSLNVRDGEFVYTKKAREDEPLHRKKLEHAIKTRKRELQEELALIEPEFFEKKNAIDSLITQQRNFVEMRRKHTGFLSIFYGRGPQQSRGYYDREIDKLEKQIEKAKNAFEPIRKRKLELKDALKFLRTHKPMLGTDYNH